MRTAGLGAAAIFVLLRFTAFAHALPADQVTRAERATALVDVRTPEGRAFGSAFCFHDKNIFITDGHVVAQSTGSIKIIVRSGESDQRVLIGHVLGIDYDADLAVLQTDTPSQADPLPMGSSDNLVATQEVTAFGYPFGNSLALDKDAYPSVTVNTGKVTALRKEGGELRLIQVDALVNHGDSGGPVLDSQGRVIGIVESGVPGAGLNFSTPVARLKKMLERPLVLIDPIFVDYSQRNRQQTFSIHVNSLTHDAPIYDVTLAITAEKGPNQTASGKTASGECNLQMAPTTDEKPIKYNPFTDSPPTLKFVLTLAATGKAPSIETGTMYFTNVPLDGIIMKTSGKKAVSLEPLPADAVETAMVGSTKAEEMRDIIPDEQPATAVHYSVATWQGKPVVQSLRVYRGKDIFGKGESVAAKHGYVVGGLIVNAGQYVYGFKVIFIREKKNKTLDTSDTYTSDWIGTENADKSEQVAGNGEQVIGTCGRQGVYLRAVGLVTKKTTSAPATQPAKH